MMCFRFPESGGVSLMCVARRLVSALVWMELVSIVAPAQTVPTVVPELQRVEPLPAVKEAASKAQVPTSGIVTGRGDSTLRPGDSVTALVSHLDNGKMRQWVVFLKANVPEAKYMPSQPPADLMMYSTSGRQLRIPGKIGGIAIRVLGPFSDGDGGSKKAKDRWSGALVNETYLGLGLDRACAMMLRVEGIAETLKGQIPEKFRIGFGSHPFPAVEQQANRAVMDKLGITEDDERALMGSFPALVSFFQVIVQTQGLEDILRSVLEVSWLGLLKNKGNLVPNFEYLNPFTELKATDWGLDAQTRCYAVKFQLSLNGKPALNCQMAVTAPRPPLLTSAGVVGIAARRPDGTGPVLLLQILDARCVEEVVQPEVSDAGKGGTDLGKS